MQFHTKPIFFQSRAWSVNMRMFWLKQIKSHMCDLIDMTPHHTTSMTINVRVMAVSNIKNKQQK